MKNGEKVKINLKLEYTDNEDKNYIQHYSIEFEINDVLYLFYVSLIFFSNYLIYFKLFSLMNFFQMII